MTELIQISDGSSWPNPSFNYDKTIAWKLRQGHELSQYEKNCIATMVESYNQLVLKPQFGKKLPMIRKALKQEAGREQ